MAALATVADVADRGHTVDGIPAEQQMEHLLRLGSALLRLRFSTIDARIAAGTLDSELVVDVLVAMVLRSPSIVDPERIKSESNGNYSVTYESVRGPSGDVELWVTDQEITLLAPLEESRPLFGSARLRAMLS